MKGLLPFEVIKQALTYLPRNVFCERLGGLGLVCTRARNWPVDIFCKRVGMRLRYCDIRRLGQWMYFI